jgi:spore maturation protein CgeB
MDYWRDLGYEPKSLMNAADTLTYMGGLPKDHLKCDVSMISGKWPYKSRNLDNFFLPLCYPVGKYNIKIWGWGWEVIPQYLGQIDEDEVKHVFASSKITVNIHEPHSTVFGHEATERMYKALAGGSLVISDYVKTIEEDIYPNGEIPMAKTAPEMEELVQIYLSDNDKRERQLALGRTHTFRHHTYFDRVADLFGYLGLPDESVKALEVKTQHLNGHVPAH